MLDIRGLNAKQVETLSYHYLRGKEIVEQINYSDLMNLFHAGSLGWSEFLDKADNYLQNLWAVEEEGA